MHLNTSAILSLLSAFILVDSNISRASAKDAFLKESGTTAARHHDQNPENKSSARGLQTVRTSESLNTGFAGGNSNDGAMFQINALNCIVLKYMSINSDSDNGSEGHIDIYTREGILDTTTRGSSGWTKVGDNIKTTLNPESSPTPLPDDAFAPIRIEAGTSMSFYVTFIDNNNLSYTNGGAFGNVWKSDTNIEFLEGYGVTYEPAGFSSFFNNRVFNGILEYELCSNTNSGGDPHFIGFNQNLVTFQGECTLILLESTQATSSGEDVTIHVRTTRKFDFSYISGVAMKIGDEVIEVKPNGDLLMNGISMNISENMTMSGLPFTIIKEEKGTKKMIVAYSFDIGQGRVIDVQANKKRSMMFVRTKGNFPMETQGLLGSPSKTEMVSRDGVKLSDIDAKIYGESWQVRDTDIQLFQESVAPQFPQKCLYEDAPGAATQLRGRRKLMTKKVVTLDEAEAACAGVRNNKRALCIQDSISMGELDLKDDPFYLE